MNSNEKQPKKSKKKRQSNLFYDVAKLIAAPSALLFFRHKTVYMGKGKTPWLKGGVMISSNHIGFLDPVLLHCVFWRRRLNVLATTDLYNTKAKKWFFEHAHCIPVDKKNFSMNSFHAVCDRLQEGKAVLIFPEGQVNGSEDKAMQAFKSGAVLMAHRANAPILPVCILPLDKWYSRRVVLVGDPVYVRDVAGERPSMLQIEQVSNLLRQTEIELKSKYEERLAAKKNKKKQGEITK